MFITTENFYSSFRHKNAKNITELMQYLAYDPETQLFLTENHNLFFALELSPVVSLSQRDFNVFGDIFNDKELYYPNDIIQINLYKFYNPENTKTYNYEKTELYNLKDIPLPKIIKNYLDNKNPKDELQKAIIENRCKIFYEGNKTSLIKGLKGYRPVDFCCVLTYKSSIEINDETTEKKEMERMLTIREKIIGSLNIIGITHKNMNETDLISILNNIFMCRHKVEISNNIPLKYSVADGEIHIYENKNQYFIMENNKDKKVVNVLTIKKAPVFVQGGEIGQVIGDYFDSSNARRIPAEFIMSLVIIIQDFYKNKQFIEKEKNFWTGRNARGIAEKLNDIEIALRKLNEGINFHRAIFTLFILNNSEEESEGNKTIAKGLMEEKGFIMQEENILKLPLFFANLPANFNPEFEYGFLKSKKISLDNRELGFVRSFIAFSDNLARISPIFGDFKGIENNPSFLFIGKRGQIIGYDFFQGSHSYSTIIFGGSGKGKSVLLNELIMQYYSEMYDTNGNKRIDKIFVIEVGYSFRKIAEILKAQYFDLSSLNLFPCLNPFALLPDNPADITDTDREMAQDMVKLLYSTKGTFSPELDGSLSKVTQLTIERFGNKATIDDLYNVAVEVVGEINANAFFDYTTMGTKKSYFTSNHVFKFDNDINIISIPSFNQVGQELMILLIFSFVKQINNVVYKENGMKKLIIIDEAHNFLNNRFFLTFADKWVRELRKYMGAVFFATQSVIDFINNPETVTLFQISANKVYFQHEKEKVQQLAGTGALTMDGAILELLPVISTQKGKYSEFIIQSETGFVVSRLVLDRFSQLLYTTDVSEINKIKKYQDQGLSLVEAIYQVIKEE